MPARGHRLTFVPELPHEHEPIGTRVGEDDGRAVRGHCGLCRETADARRKEPFTRVLPQHHPLTTRLGARSAAQQPACGARGDRGEREENATTLGLAHCPGMGLDGRSAAGVRVRPCVRASPNASANSLALPNRSAGSFCSAVRTAPSTAGLTVGRFGRSGGGCSVSALARSPARWARRTASRR